MDKLDSLVLQTVAERVFKPERVKLMLSELQDNLKKSGATHNDQLKTLTKELNLNTKQSDRLLEGVEMGVLPMNDALKERVHKHQARWQEILTDIAGLRRDKELPLTEVGPKQVNAFCASLKLR